VHIVDNLVKLTNECMSGQLLDFTVYCGKVMGAAVKQRQVTSVNLM